MQNRIDNVLAFQEKALGLRAHRQQVLAGNIANAAAAGDIVDIQVGEGNGHGAVFLIQHRVVREGAGKVSAPPRMGKPAQELPVFLADERVIQKFRPVPQGSLQGLF